MLAIHLNRAAICTRLVAVIVVGALAALCGCAPQDAASGTDDHPGHSHAGDAPHDHAHSPEGGHSHGPHDGHSHGPDDGHNHGPDDGHSHGPVDGHSHGPPPVDDHDHDEATALRLSAQEEANIGLGLMEVTRRPFARSIAVPAEVVHRPGRSQVDVTAVFTGIVQRIYHTEGEAVEIGMPLFDLRLTHEELVQAQAEMLQTYEELAVVKREVERIGKVVSEGAVAGKTLLENQYLQQRLEAKLHAQKQRLLLHRLSAEQIDKILETRTLLQDMTIHVPECDGSDGACSGLYHIEKLAVQLGQHVEAGDSLCTLSDHYQLFIKGRALEQDIPVLSEAVDQGWTVAAGFDAHGSRPTLVEDLKLLYLSSEVDPQSRAFEFYVSLTNKIVRDTKMGDGRRYVDWKYKPGQRARLNVPAEPAEERIVLPAEAVVRDQNQWFVFEFIDDHFDRRSVHVEHREPDWVVIADDGPLKPGAKVAVSGAYQIHLATKNKNAAPIDPHAGHTH